MHMHTHTHHACACTYIAKRHTHTHAHAHAHAHTPVHNDAHAPADVCTCARTSGCGSYILPRLTEQPGFEKHDSIKQGIIRPVRSLSHHMAVCMHVCACTCVHARVCVLQIFFSDWMDMARMLASRYNMSGSTAMAECGSFFPSEHADGKCRGLGRIRGVASERSR